jgi:hypothetical protein
MLCDAFAAQLPFAIEIQIIRLIKISGFPRKFACFCKRILRRSIRTRLKYVPDAWAGEELSFLPGRVWGSIRGGLTAFKNSAPQGIRKLAALPQSKERLRTTSCSGYERRCSAAACSASSIHAEQSAKVDRVDRD